MPKLAHANTLPASERRPSFLRSKSSEALLKATYEIRKKHQHLLLETEKKGRKSNDPRATASSLELYQGGEDIINGSIAHQSKADIYPIRRRKSDSAKTRHRVASLPSSSINRSLSSLSRFKVNLDDDSPNTQTKEASASSSKPSFGILTAKQYEKVLNGLRERNALSRKQDEVMAAVEKQRHINILEMYQKYFERRNHGSRTSLNKDPLSKSRSLRSDSGASSDVIKPLNDENKVSDPMELDISGKNDVFDFTTISHKQVHDNGTEESREDNLSEIKQKINALETQISKSTSEFEVERALLEVKITAERKCLNEEEANCEKIKVKIIQLEEEYIKKREKYHDEVQEKNLKLQNIQDRISETEKQIEKSPESMRELMEENLKKELENMKDEMKNLEDTEFHMLETMSNLDEEKEKLQRNLILEKKRLDFKINNRTNRLKMLQNQMTDLERQEKQASQRLFQDRDAAIGLLQEQKQKSSSLEAADINQKDSVISSAYPTPSSALQRHPSTNSRRLMSLESFLDSISLSEKSDLANQKPSDKPVSTSVTSVRMRHTRRSLNYSDETSSSKPLEQKEEQTSYQTQTKNLKLKDSRASLLSTESFDSALSAISTSIEDERLREMQRRLAEAQAKKEILLHDISMARNSMHGSSTLPDFQSCVKTETENSDLSLPQDTSSVVLRTNHKRKRQNRPMSRYLPNRSSDFNLREHIESCGHNPANCRHVVLTATSCSGYLSRKGGKLRSWKKRWFVFDRVQKMLVVYGDKRELKEKGRISFQLIEDIFIDHLKSQKAPNPSLTFCMKCNDRFHHFSAPSSDAMSIWMDVLVTGAEGYREYMKTIDQQFAEKNKQ